MGGGGGGGATAHTALAVAQVQQPSSLSLDSYCTVLASCAVPDFPLILRRRLNIRGAAGDVKEESGRVIGGQMLLLSWKIGWFMQESEK